MKAIRTRWLLLGLALLSLLVVLSPVAVGLYATRASYRGTCFSLEWGQYRCSRGEYAVEAGAWGLVLVALPLGVCLAPLWVFVLWRRVVNNVRSVGLWSVLAAGGVGALGGIYFVAKTLGWLP